MFILVEGQPLLVILFQHCVKPSYSSGYDLLLSLCVGIVPQVLVRVVALEVTLL